MFTEINSLEESFREIRKCEVKVRGRAGLWHIATITGAQEAEGVDPKFKTCL